MSQTLALALNVYNYWLTWKVAIFGEAQIISKFQRQSLSRRKEKKRGGEKKQNKHILLKLHHFYVLLDS